jgi:hypothetical protein
MHTGEIRGKCRGCHYRSTRAVNELPPEIHYGIQKQKATGLSTDFCELGQIECSRIKSCDIPDRIVVKKRV